MKIMVDIRNVEMHLDISAITFQKSIINPVYSGHLIPIIVYISHYYQSVCFMPPLASEYGLAIVSGQVCTLYTVHLTLIMIKCVMSTINCTLFVGIHSVSKSMM